MRSEAEVRKALEILKQYTNAEFPVIANAKVIALAWVLEELPWPDGVVEIAMRGINGDEF